MPRTFPATRLRRNRYSQALRDLVQETQLSAKDFIYPVFVLDGPGKKREEITSMPGQYRLSLESLFDEAESLLELGIPAIALFPNVDKQLKTLDGAEAYNPNGLVPRAVQALKERFPELALICDGALDPYTTHGQDGIINADAYVLNDETTATLRKQARINAEAGADIIAPSLAVLTGKPKETTQTKW
jgi:porphobilinogen synthase